MRIAFLQNVDEGFQLELLVFYNRRSSAGRRREAFHLFFLGTSD